MISRIVIGACLLAAIAAGIVFYAVSPKLDDGDTYYLQLNHDGLIRGYRLHLPPGYDGVVQRPLLIVFHDSGSSPDAVAHTTGFDRISSQEGFFAVYPEAMDNQWRIADDEPNDITFVRDLLDFLIEGYTIDKTRVYATGVSQGGRMARAIAAKLADRITAAAALLDELPGEHGLSANPAYPILALNNDLSANAAGNDWSAIHEAPNDARTPYTGRYLIINAGNNTDIYRVGDVWQDALPVESAYRSPDKETNERNLNVSQAVWRLLASHRHDA